MLPRGIRNNNPGNIRKSSSAWLGLAVTQPDADFCVFSMPQYGLRALMHLLMGYYSRYGLKTVRDIIEHYAPPNENNTESYIKSVADRLGVGPDEDINVRNESILVPLAKCIVRHENGDPSEFRDYVFRKEFYWYPDQLYEAAVAMLRPPEAQQKPKGETT